MPKGVGETTITVKTKGGLEASCRVKVEHLPTEAAISGIPKVIYVGDEFTLSAVVSPAGISDASVTWANEGVRAELVDAEKGIFRASPAVSTPPSESPAPAILKGDVNGDGMITLLDAQLALQYALKIKTPSEAEKDAADVDNNGKVELKDAQQVLKYALKIINKFE